METEKKTSEISATLFVTKGMLGLNLVLLVASLVSVPICAYFTLSKVITVAACVFALSLPMSIACGVSNLYFKSKQKKLNKELDAQKREMVIKYETDVKEKEVVCDKNKDTNKEKNNSCESIIITNENELQNDEVIEEKPKSLSLLKK